MEVTDSNLLRCPAKAGALEDPEAHSDWVRTQEFREQLLRSFNAGTVWDEYGYLPDIVVCMARIVYATDTDYLVTAIHCWFRTSEHSRAPVPGSATSADQRNL